MWYIVVYIQENSVSVVPATWYVEQTRECFWPPARIKKSMIEKYIKNKNLPEEDWKPFKAQLLGKYNDYKQALSKVHKAYDKDKLSTTDDNEDVGREKRKKKPSYRNHLSSSEADKSDASDNSISFPNFFHTAPRHSETQESYVNFEGESSQKQLNGGRIDLQQNSSLSVMCNESRQLNKMGKRRSRSLSPPAGPLSSLPIFRNRSEPAGLPSPKHSFMPQNLFSQEIRNSESHMHQNSILEILQKMQAVASEFRVQVLRKLNTINMKVNDLETLIENLRNSETIRQSDENGNDEFIDLFPLNVEKLNSLENLLLKEDEMKKLIKYLSRVGGSCVSEIVKRLMYKMFTNEVGNLFSWDGAKGKRKFRTLNLSNVILNTVRANNYTKDATEAEIIMYIKKWLVRSKDRMNLEKKKSSRNENQEADKCGEVS